MDKSKEDRLKGKIKSLEVEVMDLQSKLKETEKLLFAEYAARDAAEDELDHLRRRLR